VSPSIRERIHPVKRRSSADRPPDPIAFVLSPTRELAQQTAEVAGLFAPPMGYRQCCVFGGAGRFPQAMELRHRPAMVVACPGRMIDFIESEPVRMDRVAFLVLDEADRILDMGAFEERGCARFGGRAF
jgi:superfamily II DNA/RNA helicase